MDVEALRAADSPLSISSLFRGSLRATFPCITGHELRDTCRHGKEPDGIHHRKLSHTIIQKLCFHSFQKSLKILRQVNKLYHGKGVFKGRIRWKILSEGRTHHSSEFAPFIIRINLYIPIIKYYNKRKTHQVTHHILIPLEALLVVPHAYAQVWHLIRPVISCL